MVDYHGHDCFFVEAENSHHGYVSTSSNNKVFCQQGYLPE